MQQLLQSTIKFKSWRKREAQSEIDSSTVEMEKVSFPWVI